MTLDNKRMMSLKEHIIKANELNSVTPQKGVSNSFLKTLAINLSDKLRSPLFVIKSYTQLLQKNQDKDRLQRGFKLMEEASKKMENTISELVNLVEIYTNEAPNRDLVYFREVIDKAKYNLSDIWESDKINLNVDFTEVSKIWFSKSFLETIITELLANAILHNADQKQINIKVCSYSLPNRRVLHIEDNGKGYTQYNTTELVDDPFNSQTQLSQCLGVGLSKIQAIAKVTNSVFDIENNPDKGTVCRFYFR